MSPAQEIYFKIAIGIAYAIFEYWLGKTKKVQSNSTIEMILNFIKNFIAVLKR